MNETLERLVRLTIPEKFAATGWSVQDYAPGGRFVV
jgi:hypothetical protein